MAHLSPLETALAKFQDTLTPDQLNEFKQHRTKPDPHAVLTFTAQLDELSRQNGYPGVSMRVSKFLDSVQEYSAVVDIFVSSNPHIAALIWGSIKFCLLAAGRISSFLDKVSKAMMEMRRHCPRLAEYKHLFADDQRLQLALNNYYALVINFCQRVVEVSQRSNFAHVSNALMRSYEMDFGPLQSNLQDQYKQVEGEITLAAHRAAQREQQLQSAERKKMSVFRREERARRQKDEQAYSIASRQRTIKERWRLLDQLPSHDSTPTFRLARSNRWGSTCSWIFDVDKYMCWRQKDQPSFLWCSGKMGCGKTVLSATVLEHLLCDKSPSRAHTVFFFCDPDYEKSLNASNVIGSLIKQVQNAEHMTATFEKLLSELTSTPRLYHTDHTSLLVEAIGTKPIEIVIDGIDGCSAPDRRHIFSVLQGVLAKCSNVKVFLAANSFLHHEIQNEFPTHLEIPADNTASVAAYIDGFIAEQLESGNLNVRDPQLLPEIRNCLMSGAQGMFLWVVFQVSDLCRQKTDDGIRKSLDDLPPDLPTTYERLLRRIAEQDPSEHLRQAFKWIAVSKRPLSLEELCEAIIIQSDQTSRPHNRLLSDSSTFIRDSIGLLVEDESEGTAHFSHSSIRDFLAKPPSSTTVAEFHFGMKDTDLMIGSSCMTYLNYNDFKTQLVRRRKDIAIEPEHIIRSAFKAETNVNIPLSWMKAFSKARVRQKSERGIMMALQSAAGQINHTEENIARQYPFLSYAKAYWLLHLRQLSEVDFPLIWLKFLDLIGRANSLAELPWTEEQWESRQPCVYKWAVDADHEALLYVLLHSKDYRDVKTIDEMLNLAVCAEKMDLVRLLVRKSESPEKAVGCALVIAAYYSLSEAVDALLLLVTEVNADIDAFFEIPVEECGMTALGAAAGTGNLQVVDRLLAAGADVNGSPRLRRSRTALESAATAGHLNIVERLLAAGANVNARSDSDFRAQTALHGAIALGNIPIVERLLDAGADVEVVNGMGKTPFMLAELSGRGDIVNLLLPGVATPVFPRPTDPIPAIRKSFRGSRG